MKAIWNRNFEILTNFPDQIILRFLVPWNGRNLFVITVDKNAMIASLAMQITVMDNQVTDKISCLH